MKASGKGPLFYNEPKELAAPNDPTNPYEPRYVKAREHVAAWVRGLAVNDPELSPNHAACPKRYSTPSLDIRPLRSDVATTSLRLRTRLKSFANFRGTNAPSKSDWPHDAQVLGEKPPGSSVRRNRSRRMAHAASR